MPCYGAPPSNSPGERRFSVENFEISPGRGESKEAGTGGQKEDGPSEVPVRILLMGWDVTKTFTIEF